MHLSSSRHGIRIKPHRESYTEVGGDTWNISDGRERSRDILVRYDFAVVGAKSEIKAILSMQMG